MTVQINIPRHHRLVRALPERANCASTTSAELIKDCRSDSEVEKCSFLSNTIDYFGHSLRARRLQIARDTTKAFKRLKPRTNFTNPRSLYGLCNVFRRFVSIFARLAEPLNWKLRKDQPMKLVRLTAEPTVAMKEPQN